MQNIRSSWRVDKNIVSGFGYIKKMNDEGLTQKIYRSNRLEIEGGVDIAQERVK